MKLVSGLFVALLWTSGAAAAMECRGLDETVEGLRRHGGAVEVVDSPRALVRAMALFNAQPGDPLVAADRVLVVNRGPRGGALLFAAGGKVCRSLTVEARDWPFVRAEVLGWEV